MNVRLEFYISESGRIPVKKYIRNIVNKKERAKLLAALDSFEKFGFETPKIGFRQIRGKLWEMRINIKGKAHRLFYMFHLKNEVVLLHAYLKKTRRAPAHEIAVAEARMKEVAG